MTHHDDCIFCQIISGAMPGHIVYEDELSLAIMDAYPVSPGHLLILTRAHYADIFEANPNAIAAVAANSVMLSGALDRVIRPDGLGIHQLNKAAAGQTVFHYHLHLIPRFAGDAIELHSRTAAQADELAMLASQIREQLP